MSGADGGVGPDAAGRAGEPRRPVLRVVRGNPTPEQLAALVAVLAARSRHVRAAAERGAGAGAPTASLWADRAAQLRRPVAPAPGAWRASAWRLP